MTALVLYPLLTAALFYLGSRAEITHFLWSRYPHRFAKFMDCPYCAGTWYGAGVAAFGGYVLGLDFLTLGGEAWTTIVVVALCSMMWTPMVAGLTQHSYFVLGSAVDAPVEPPVEAEPPVESEPAIVVPMVQSVPSTETTTIVSNTTEATWFRDATPVVDQTSKPAKARRRKRKS